MASNAQITVTGKSFGKNAIPEETHVGAKATFKKKINGTALSLSLTDATFKDQGQTLKDVVLTAERQLSGGCLLLEQLGFGVQQAYF